MTSNHHAPYDLGYTRATMVSDKGKQPREGKACTKLESLVIADQHAAVNTFPGLVHTARHTMGVRNTRSQWPNCKEGAAEGGADNWGEVVTR